jgi:hypothetical protein
VGAGPGLRDLDAILGTNPAQPAGQLGAGPSGINQTFADGGVRTMEFIQDGYCGLYCGACPDFLDTQAGMVRKCCGCKSNINNPEWCSICNIKSCARERKIDFCYQCGEYPCIKLKSFIEDINYPYHQEVTGYMKIIEREGKDIWAEKMKTRWSCQKCKRAVSWWEPTCKECGEKLNGYGKP